MRRKPRGRLAGRPVARLVIAAQRALDEGGEPRLRARFAGRPGLCEPARPVRAGRRQAEVGDRRPDARIVGPARRREPRGSRRRGGKGAEREGPAPEGGKHPERRAPVGPHFPGFAQQLAVEALRIDARAPQRGLHARIDRDLGRPVAARPQRPLRAGRFREPGEDRLRRPAQDVEPAPGRLDIARKRGERSREPPARSPAEPPQAFAVLVMNIDDQRRRAAGGGQRRMVVEAEIVAEPDDGRRVAFGRGFFHGA